MKPLPQLIEDTTTEILLRLPPDDPACLIRAALVCKPWRRIVSDPAFSRRYREFHRTPPLLGYLRCHYPYKNELFATTAFPFSYPAFKCTRWEALDCRHGHVLLHHIDPRPSLLVWDPITNYQRYLPVPSNLNSNKYHAGAVLCAADGYNCDHLNCPGGGPFKVVFVLNGDDRVTRLYVYSSETGLWSPPASIPRVGSFVEGRGTLYVGRALYFTFHCGKGFLRYDLADDEQGRLSVINVPEGYDNQIRRPTIGIVDEEGRLGFAALDEYGDVLYIWSLQAAGPDGAAKWEEQARVIDLKPLFHVDISTIFLSLSGFAEVSGSGIFSLDLKSSGQARKIHEDEWHSAIMPYMSFYTPGNGEFNEMSKSLKKLGDQVGLGST
ncbi:hypothetical protein U9M48_012021 [Paspalum notatum var. saurae]|uniref:F-box domain-containing protein n=1 Tax=Paspalum notatum var. saurae TaxID=547442 RepID=A0AAQ3SWZ2_PASNO